MTEHYWKITRPPIRGSELFKAPRKEMMSRQEPNKDHKPKELFTIVINAISEKGISMNHQPINEQQFLVDLIFKPVESGLKLRPEETQLLLSYLGEILKEIQDEENLIAEVQNVANEEEITSCK